MMDAVATALCGVCVPRGVVSHSVISNRCRPCNRLSTSCCESLCVSVFCCPSRRCFLSKGEGLKKKATTVVPSTSCLALVSSFILFFLVSDVQTANKREEAERRLGSFDSVCLTSAGLVSHHPPLLLSHAIMWPFQQVAAARSQLRVIATRPFPRLPSDFIHFEQERKQTTSRLPAAQPIRRTAVNPTVVDN